MADLSEHFNRSELACKCGCGCCDVSQRLLAALERLRAEGPEPIIIHDCYRCEKHNREVSGAPHSEHVTGEAADLGIKDLTLQQMYERAEAVPDFRAGGIGAYSEGFVHVDVRLRRARWARKNGVYLGLDTLVKPAVDDQ